MTDESRTRGSSLLCVAGQRVCALPLSLVQEIMRPLPIEAFANAPSFVLGLSMIRGEPVPVVDLAAVIGVARDNTTRFITLSVAQRHVALAVDSVIGVRALPDTTLRAVPPLLHEATADLTTAIGRLDSQFLVVLSGARLLPTSALGEFPQSGGGA